MKTFILLISIFVSNFALAQVLDVQSDKKVVYYAPTPVLWYQFIDLDKDGGVLTIALDYQSGAHAQQSSDLKRKYPGFELKPLVVRAAVEKLTVAIPEVGLSQETILRQAQMGPLLSVQFSLSREQVTKLKALIKDHPERLAIAIPVKADVRGVTELEAYETSMEACTELRVQTTGDLMNALTVMKRPAQIRYEQTFQKFKMRLLEECFELPGPVKLNSFTEMLRTRIRPKQSNDVLRAVFSEERVRELSVELKPILKIETL